MPAGTDLEQRFQPVQHIEAGIATNGLDYLPAAVITPGAPRQFRRGVIGGSFVPVNGVTDYFRKPGELGWGHAIPGTTVSVVWGRPGTAQLEIRATVAALPFKPDNRRIDVSAL